MAQPPTTVAGLLARYDNLSHEAAKVSARRPGSADAKQRSLLGSSEYSRADVSIPPGDVGAVLRFVLAQLGKPYVW